LIENLQTIANRLRRHVIKMTYAAGSGHPGGSLSAADMMAALYFHELHLDPVRPDWPDRDRFIMSKGHACPVWYAALAERGYFPVAELVKLRQADSHLQGHPDMRKTPGVDMTAGPLGNGLSAGVGMALGARITGRSFRTYVMLGEGDQQEGCTWEAAMLAGFHKLANLAVLIDYNRSQVDGKSDAILCLDPLPDKWRAANWAVREIDGHDLGQILDALDWARSGLGAPAAILAHTTKGQGVSFMLDRHEWHGTAPNAEQAVAALAELGETWQPPPRQTRPKLARPDLTPSPPSLTGKEESSPHPLRGEGVGATIAMDAFGVGGFPEGRLRSAVRSAQLRPATDRPRRTVREAFGQTLVELGNELPTMVVLDADISSSLKTGAFRQRYPERHINFGVAEQNMLAAAAGLSTAGLIPLACTYATFATMRACEQIRSFICYSRLNVKVICSHGGLEVGWDGPTHQGTEDIAIMRAMPNMTIVVPADAAAVPSLLRQVVALDGPAYFRMGRNPVPVIYAEGQEFKLGQAITLREGSDLTIIALGVMAALALDAAESLVKGGIQARVLDMHTVKPLDGAAVERAARETGAIVTAEDHTILGGLGGAVAEYLAEHAPVPMLRVGMPDTFGRSGDPAELFPMYGMAASDIVAAARRVLDRK
jgi:transketolase